MSIEMLHKNITIQKNYIIDLCDNQVNVIEDDNKKWYCGGDICKILHLKCARSSIRTVPKVNKNKFIFKLKNGSGGRQTTTFIDDEGMVWLVKNTRSINAEKLANEIGISCKIRFTPFETTSLTQIMECFAGENMVHQFSVNNFRIDLYFVDYKLAIECDEPEHYYGSKPQKDKEREEKIKEKLNCEFIRFNPCSTDFKMTSVLNMIFKHIKNYNTSKK